MNFKYYITKLKIENQKIYFLCCFIIFVFIENFVIEILDINYIQVSPLTGYGMYSEKMSPRKSYSAYIVTINGNERIELWKYNQQNKQILSRVLDYYCEMKQNTDQDLTRNFLIRKFHLSNSSNNTLLNKYTNSSKEYVDFPKWYRRYLEQSIGKIVTSYKVEKVEMKYSKKQELLFKDTINLIQYE